MKHQKKDNITVQNPGQDLATFAIDRTDVKEFLAAIPENGDVNLTTIEYELQILKILSVGLAISYFMPATDKKKGQVSQIFWECIRELSQNISTLAKTTTGQNIDYFETLKQRLDIYLATLQKNPENAQNPASMIGPAFANACDSKDNAFAILTGTKMFTLTLGAVKEYLEAIKIDDINLN